MFHQEQKLCPCVFTNMRAAFTKRGIFIHTVSMSFSEYVIKKGKLNQNIFVNHYPSVVLIQFSRIAFTKPTQKKKNKGEQ